MFKKFVKNEKGFTLVELIVVIAILAVLATLLIPRIMGNVKEAAEQSQISTARTLASEITIWNAKALTDGDTATVPIPAGVETGTGTFPHTVVLTDLTVANGLKLTDDADFPKDTVVKILVDSKGNAYIDIVGTPTTTP